MTKKWLLGLGVLAVILLSACGVKQPEKNSGMSPDNTVVPSATITSVPTIVPTAKEDAVISFELQYVSFSEMPDAGKTIYSLLNDEECEYSLCTEQDDIIIAILAEKKMEILSDATVNGEESFYIVFYSKKDGKILFKEKKVAEQGFQIACAQEENRAYVIVLSRNDYCDVEYYDMNVYRMFAGTEQTFNRAFTWCMKICIF